MARRCAAARIIHLEEDLELIEIATQAGSAVVSDTHLEMLRDILGAAVLVDEGEEAGSRPWSIYSEDITASAAECNARLASGSAGVLPLYSIDAPHLLQWSCGPTPAHAAEEEEEEEWQPADVDDSDDDERPAGGARRGDDIDMEVE